MNAWPLCNLSSVASVFNGKTPSKSDQRTKGHPVLKIKDVSAEGEFRGRFESFVEASFSSKYETKLLRAGDSLILNAAHNASHVASKKYFAEPAALGSLITGEWLVVRPFSSEMDSRFIYHWLSLPRTQSDIHELINGIHLYPKDVAVLKVPVPPLAQQRRIVDILDQSHGLMRKRKRSVTLTGELAQSIFLDMFGDTVRNSLGWDDSRVLGEVSDVVSGITKGRKAKGPFERIPYLAVANVQDMRLDLSAVKDIDATRAEIGKYRLKRNDLLLTEGGDPDKLGRGTLWCEELSIAIHQNHIFRVRLRKDSGIHPVFLNWLIASERGRQYFLRSAKQTTGIASINSTQLKRFPLLVPPWDLQLIYADRLEQLGTQKTLQQAQGATLDALYASLQAKAFSGEL